MRKTGTAFFSMALVVFICGAVSAQTTEFTYQGSLKNGANPATGSYDFQFTLFDSLSGGNQIGATLTKGAVAVTAGAFAVSLDFGNQFPGANRYLEIHVRVVGQPSYTTLTPRQPVNSSPYSVKSVNSDTSTNSNQLGGIPANQYVTTTTGATNFVQNTTAQQSANFNISGNGIVNGSVGIGTNAPTAKLHLVGGGIIVNGGNVVKAVLAETQSGGEAVDGECLTANNNCYAISSFAPTGDYAGYMTGGRGVYVSSNDTNHAALDAKSYGSANAVNAEATSFRAGYFKSDDSLMISLLVDNAGGFTQTTPTLYVRGTIEGEGNLIIQGSKAGFVVDIMQNADTTDLAPGDVVVIVGNAPPVQGRIPVVTVRKATSAYDTAVAGVVDEVWYAPSPETKAAYEAQENARREAMQQRSKAQADFRARMNKTDAADRASTEAVKMSEPDVPEPLATITDEQGTLHSLPGVTRAAPGAYLSVVTLGSYKIVKVDAAYGPIRAGDLLTTSPHAGYAMKVTDKSQALGAIIGKSLGSLDSGTGTIPILVLSK